MIKVAICDDLKEDAEKIKLHIEQYSREKSLEFSVMAFSDRDEILAVLDKADEYDLLLLDIYMESVNGIDLARGIRQQSEKSRIIFFSTST